MVRRALAMSPALLLAACSAEPPSRTVDVTPTGSASTHATAAPSTAGAAKPSIAHCSSGPDRCAPSEVCCRAASAGPVVEYCAPRLTEPEAKDNLLAACGAKIPAAAKSGDLSIALAALACVDSADCGADEICVSGAFFSGDSLASMCAPKKAAYGLAELCGRGTCKLGRSACEKEPPSATTVEDLATCVGTTPVVCGKAACKPGEVCVGDDKGARCGPPPADLGQGAVLGCTANAQCPETQVCCLVGAGSLGAHCAFGCDVAMERRLCASDADCKGLMEGMTFACKPEADPPLKGVKTCQ
ncbi:MAG: hypothetical protein U0414_19320 [Polyangiaceae bacterium]